MSEKKSIVTRAAYSLLGLFLLVYVGYHVYLAVGVNMKTERINRQNVQNIVNAEAVILRDEEQIQADTNGVSANILNDGDKIEKGGSVGYVFSSYEYAQEFAKRKDLEKEIETLQNAQKHKGTSSIDPEAINKEIYEKIYQMEKVILSGQYDRLPEMKDEYLNLINRKQIIIEKETDFSAKISELTNQLNSSQELSAEYVREIKASESGYFCSSLDGYENSLDYKSVFDITPKQAKSVIDAEAAQTQEGFGKIVKNSEWYLLCVMSADDARLFKTKDKSSNYANDVYVSVSLPSIYQNGLKASVENINVDGDEAIVTLKCNRIDQSLLNFRKGKAQIIIDDYTGLQINNKAIRIGADKDGNETQGVYALRGNMIQFLKINPIYQGDSFTLSETPIDKATGVEKSGYVQLYDEVILEGKDLYDGKVIK